MFKNLFGRSFIVTFVVTLIFNVLIIAIGMTLGYTDELTWAGFSDTLGDLFGGISSFLGLILLLVVAIVAVHITFRLSQKGQHTLLIIWVAVLIVLAVLFAPHIDLKDLSFGAGPLLGFLAFTAIEALVITWALPKFVTVRSHN